MSIERSVKLAWRGCAAAALAVAISACSKRTPPDALRNASSVTPPDQLAASEIPESREEAFGLPIPDQLRVRKRAFDVVMAEGSLPREWVVEFVRGRVDGGSIEEAGTRTSFVDVNVRAPRSPWRGRLRIDVDGDDRFTTLRLHGEPAPPADEGRAAVVPPRAEEDAAAARPRRF